MALGEVDSPPPGGAARAPSPATEGVRGPVGLADGDQAAQGPPPLAAPPNVLDSRTFSYFDDQVRILVCLMAHVAPTRLSLREIRAALKNAGDPYFDRALGNTTAGFRTGDVRETKVSGMSWFTAVARLQASRVLLPGELWFDDARIEAEKDPKKKQKLRHFRAAYEDILLHERKHMTEAFEALGDQPLGYYSAFGSYGSRLPDRARFESVVRSADTSAPGLIVSSANAWDALDLDLLTPRLSSHGVRIDNGPTPEIHYDPPP